MTTEQQTLREELIERLGHRPFKPFAVELSDRSRHFIIRIAQMAVGLTTGIIGEPSGNETRHIKLADIPQ